jgi:hypothetical protein
MRPRHILAAAALVVVLATGAQAIPIFGDPYTIYLLKVVERILVTIQQIELVAQAVVQRRINDLVSGYAFPASLFREIHETIDDVKDIRDEVTAIACDWRFSERTGLLRDVYLRPLKLCRPSFQLLWGSGEGHWDADLQEMQDYVGTLTTNMVSERVEAEGSWRHIFPDMQRATAVFRASPGEANRDEAVALAGAGVVADSNSAIASQTLLLAQFEREMDRFEDRKSLDMAEFLRLSMKGDDPLSNPPARE